MIIAETVGATLLVLGTVLILRECWRMDRRARPAPTRLVRSRGRRAADQEKQAA